jgi:hypothetical protein
MVDTESLVKDSFMEVTPVILQVIEKHLHLTMSWNQTHNHSGDKQVPITTKVVSLNPIHDEVYSIQHYVIKFVVTCDRLVVFSGYSGFLHQ